MLRMLALALLLLLTAPAEAQMRGWFPRNTGDCGWVHGRFAVYNGSGARRIWVIGTDHLLNLWDGDKDVPSELDVGFDRFLYGDFLVCAAERFRPGWMQQVHVRRVRNLVSRPYGNGR